MISDAVDSLGSTIERLSNRVENNSDGVSKTGSVKNLVGSKTAKRRMTKGGTISKATAERFRSMLTGVTLQFLIDAKNCLSFKIGTNNSSFLHKIQVSEQHFGSYLLENSNRQCSLSFRYPGNGQHQIALASETFSKIVCSWIKTLHAFYILHSPLLKSSSKPFVVDDVLKFQYKRYEDQNRSSSGSLKSIIKCSQSFILALAITIAVSVYHPRLFSRLSRPYLLNHS